MLDERALRRPFYNNIISPVVRRRLDQQGYYYTQGCKNWWLGQYFLIYERESNIYSDKLCSIIIKSTPILQTGSTDYIANIDGTLAEVLAKYAQGVPAELAARYPAIAEIVAVGGDKRFENGKVIMTTDQSVSFNDKTTLDERMRGDANRFIEHIEAAVREAESLIGEEAAACGANVKEEVEFLSDRNLSLPHSRTVHNVELRYCEQLKSKFWGTKRYTFQVPNGDRILTVYLMHSSMFEPKCKLVAHMRLLDMTTIDDITTVFRSGLPDDFIANYPAIGSLLGSEASQRGITLWPTELTMTVDCAYPVDINKPVPEPVFERMPLFVTMAMSLINELGNLRRTALYTAIHKAARKKSDAAGNALLRRIAFIGIGALIGASFDAPDATDVADAPDVADASDAADVSDATDVADVPDAPAAPAAPIYPSDGRFYIVRNPYGDPDMMSSMMDVMHDSGKLDDASYNFFKNFEAKIDASVAHTRAEVADLVADIDKTLQGSTTNPIGPSPADWDRFDSFEHVRENAVDSYRDALDRGDLDAAARHADIARDAQLKKEGIYSVHYTPMDLDKRAGL